mgnify:FL=1
MKHYIFILLLIFLHNCNQKFKNYRYNPFQFPYKEYYYKAKEVEIKSKNITEGEKFSFDKFYFILKNGFVDTMTFSSNIYHFYKNGKKIFIISKRVDDKMGCSDSLSRALNKDFCSSANSMKEFYLKLFTLTPESLNKKEFAGIGNQWIVHQKGAFFEQISPPLTIYNNESYIAFRQNNMLHRKSFKNGLN